MKSKFYILTILFLSAHAFAETKAETEPVATTAVAPAHAQTFAQGDAIRLKHEISGAAGSSIIVGRAIDSYMGKMQMMTDTTTSCVLKFSNSYSGQPLTVNSIASIVKKDRRLVKYTYPTASAQEITLSKDSAIESILCMTHEVNSLPQQEKPWRTSDREATDQEILNAFSHGAGHGQILDVVKGSQ